MYTTKFTFMCVMSAKPYLHWMCSLKPNVHTYFYIHDFSPPFLICPLLLFPQQASLPIHLSPGMISTCRELHSQISCAHECHFLAQQEESTSLSRLPMLRHLAYPPPPVFKCPMEQHWDPCHMRKNKREGHHQTRVHIRITNKSQRWHLFLKERK